MTLPTATPKTAPAPRYEEPGARAPDLPRWFGAAVGGRDPQRLGDAERRLIDRHFNSVTPENIMKPEPIHPEENRYHFEPADAFVSYFGPAGRGLQIVGHCLVWHQQCPGWFFDDGGTPVSADRLRGRLREHISAVVGRYRGQVAGWDVVNEAIGDNGEGLRDTPWSRTLGRGFLTEAFAAAHAADPDAELYYNDFNIERPTKRRHTVAMLRDLLAAGARVDAVGIQGHWLLDQVPFEDLKAAIETYAELGLAVAITELDLDVIDRPDCGADVSHHHNYRLDEDLYRDGCPPDVLERQAEQYGRLFELLRQYPDVVTRVTFWGLHDGVSWLNHWPGERTNHPLLFDRQCQPKPAFERVVIRARTPRPLHPAGSPRVAARDSS